MDNQTHSFLYQYARSLLDEEMQRFRNLEEKAAKYLGFLSAGIAVYTFFLSELDTLIFPPKNFFQGSACIAVALTYAAMISAWSLLYRVTSLMEMPRLQLNDEYITTNKHEPVDRVQLSLARGCVRALEAARNQNNVKANLLALGYNDITFAMWTLSISVLFTLVSVWLAYGGN